MAHDQKLDDEIDLKEFALTLLNDWRTVAATTIASAALAATYAFLVAPTTYTAEARVTGFPQAYCPAFEECMVSLGAALNLSNERLRTPEAFGVLDAVLNLSGDEDFAVTRDIFEAETRRAFLDTINVSADDTTAWVLVTHSSDRRAVELANAVAAFIVSDLEDQAQHNYAQVQRRLELQLSRLPAPTQTASAFDVQMALERSALAARVNALAEGAHAAAPVAFVDVLAALPLEPQTPSRARFLALGAVLGAFMGLGAVGVTWLHRGRLHGRGAIAGAFGQEVGEVVALRAGGPDDLRRVAFWQDVRVSLGSFTGGAITLTGAGSDAAMMRAAEHLGAEFSRSGLRVAILDLGDRMAGRATVVTHSDSGEGLTRCHDADGAASVFSCSAQKLQETLDGPLASDDVVIILPPQLSLDLPAVRDAMAHSQARVIIAQAGVITHHDVGRLVLAARGAPGPQVVAVIDRQGRCL